MTVTRSGWNYRRFKIQNIQKNFDLQYFKSMEKEKIDICVKNYPGRGVNFAADVVKNSIQNA